MALYNGELIFMKTWRTSSWWINFYFINELGWAMIKLFKSSPLIISSPLTTENEYRIINHCCGVIWCPARFIYSLFFWTAHPIIQAGSLYICFAVIISLIFSLKTCVYNRLADLCNYVDFFLLFFTIWISIFNYV